MNMLATIVPKSDQMNADDLIGGTITITVAKVAIASGEQPVAVHYEGDGGKPFKPGKSMRRVMVNAWGADANAYVGRSMTLYRDDKVKWAGAEVGGIRISHMSHIDSTLTMALTETKGSRKPFVVKPLAAQAMEGKAQPTPMEWFSGIIPLLKDRQECDAFLTAGTKRHELFSKQPEADQDTIREMLAEKMAQFETPRTVQADDGAFPGDLP